MRIEIGWVGAIALLGTLWLAIFGMIASRIAGYWLARRRVERAYRERLAHWRAASESR